MVCKNCNKELPENAKFCGGCGMRVEVEPVSAPVAAEPVAPVAPVEPVTPVTPAQEAPVQEAPVQQPPVQQAAPVRPVVPVVPPIAPKPQKPGKLLIPIVAAVLVVAIVIGLVSMLGGGAPDRYVYMNDDGELLYLDNLKKPDTAVELTDEVSTNSRIGITADGKYVYYIETKEDSNDSVGTLYRIDLSKAKKEVSEEKIDSKVFNFYLLDNGYVVYMKQGSSNRQLCLFDGTDSTKLASGNVYYRGTDEECKYLYYRETNEEWQDTIYRVELKTGEEERLIKNADYIYSDITDKYVVYGVEETVDEYESETRLYVESLEGGKEKVAKGVAGVYGISEEGGKLSFYYTVLEREEIPLEDLVDINMPQPDTDALEYPDYYDYYYWRGPFEDAEGTYYESWNDLKIYYDANKYDSVYDAADALYAEAQQDYNNAFIFESLAEYTYTFFNYTLFRYEDGESTEVMTGLDWARYLAKADTLVYTKAPDFSEPVADLQGLLDGEYEPEYEDDGYAVSDDPISVLYALLENKENDANHVIYQSKGGNESVLLEDEELDDLGLFYTLSDKEVVWETFIDGETVLSTYKVDKNGLTFLDTIAEEETIEVYADSENGKLYFFTDIDYEDVEGDLFCYANGKTEEIAKGVAGVFMAGKQQMKLEGVDYDQRDYIYTAELSLMDKKGTEITDEVTLNRGYIFLEDGGLLFIADENLCWWNGKETVVIAKDVVDFYANNQMEDVRSFILNY